MRSCFRLEVAVGERFGRLVVLSEAPPAICPSGRAVRRVRCRCDCGKETTPHLGSLHAGKTRSCGCLMLERLEEARRSHGDCPVGNSAPEYVAWQNMLRRCGDPKRSEYRLYGALGVKVCERWRLSYPNFLTDMGRRPSAGYSLDRYPDPNGNYEPSNCRWATIDQQARNKRNTRFVVLNGERMPLVDACKITGVRYRLALWRVDQGWEDEAALRPPRVKA